MADHGSIGIAYAQLPNSNSVKPFSRAPRLAVMLPTLAAFGILTSLPGVIVVPADNAVYGRHPNPNYAWGKTPRSDDNSGCPTRHQYVARGSVPKARCAAKVTTAANDVGRVLFPGYQMEYSAVTHPYGVSGVVTENTQARQGYVVRAYRRDNGALLAAGFTNSDGTFHLPILNYNGLISVIAYDDLNPTAFNAIIFDQVVPT